MNTLLVILLVCGLVLLIVKVRNHAQASQMGTLSYSEQGEGTAVILIHGVCGSSANFNTDIVSELAKHYRVISVDRNKSTIGSRDNRLDFHSGNIVELAAQLNLKAFYIVGHSLGAMIALNVAAKMPEKVMGVSLICPFITPLPSTPKVFLPLYLPSNILKFLVVNFALIPILGLFKRPFVNLIASPEKLSANQFKQGGGDRLNNFLNLCESSKDILSANRDAREIISRQQPVDCKVSLLFGSGDIVLSKQQQTIGLGQRFNNCSITEVKGGHLLPITQPDTCLHWLLPTLKTRC